MPKGKFIVFEGVDGAGKTTQVNLLMAEFQRRGFPVETYPEPGGTNIGSRIRTLLLHDETVDMHQKTKTMLFMAARAELMQLIGCRIADGVNVILDRWSYSTFAYQQDLTLREWEALTTYVSPMGWPDVTFWLDIPSEIRKHRLQGKKLDKFERQGPIFYGEVIRRYGVVCSARPEMVRIDVGDDPALMIHELILRSKVVLP